MEYQHWSFVHWARDLIPYSYRVSINLIEPDLISSFCNIRTSPFSLLSQKLLCKCLCFLYHALATIYYWRFARLIKSTWECRSQLWIDSIKSLLGLLTQYGEIFNSLVSEEIGNNLKLLPRRHMACYGKGIKYEDNSKISQSSHVLTRTDSSVSGLRNTIGRPLLRA